MCCLSSSFFHLLYFIFMDLLFIQVRVLHLNNLHLVDLLLPLFLLLLSFISSGHHVYKPLFIQNASENIYL